MANTPGYGGGTPGAYYDPNTYNGQPPPPPPPATNQTTYGGSDGDYLHNTNRPDTGTYYGSYYVPNNTGGRKGTTDPGYVPGAPAPAPAPYGAPPPAPPETVTGELSGPGYGEQNYLNNQAWWNAPTAQGDYWNSIKGQFNGPTAGETRMAGDAATLRDTQTANETLWGRLASGQDEGYNAMKQTLPELSQQGAMERFDANGLNEFYDRQFETGSRRLDTASAARGGFNSGAALRGIQELDADLSAQHAKDRMTAAQQAQEAMLSRLTQKGAVGNNMGGLEADVAGNASDSAIDRVNKAAGFEKTGIDSALQRVATGSGIAGGADSADLAKHTGQQNAATGAEIEKETGAGNEFDRTFKLGSTLAETVGKSMDTAQKEKWDAFQKYLEGLVAKGSITAQERQAAAEDMLALLKIPASVAGMSKWGSAGGTNPLVKQYQSSQGSPDI